jgi:Xaa-Pro aminopeptidase
VDKFKDEKVQKHLKDNNIKLTSYESIAEDVAKLEGRKVGVELVSVNAKICSILNDKADEMINIGEEIPLLKQKKNATELNGYRACHIRDGAGLIKYLAWLEHQLNVLNRTDLDEYMGAEKVLEYRKEQDMFMGLSFHTISSIGPNGSIVHYEPEKGNSAILNNKEIYLLDSGAHYL